MNIFIDTISSSAYLILFDKSKKIVEEYSWNIKGKESSTLIPKVDELLKNNNLRYEDLENIVLVNGPGSFTGVRTSVLVVNTINYIIKKNLIPLSYFDLFHESPIIKSSSKRDCFVQFEKDSKIEIMKNDDVFQTLQEKNIETIYGEIKTEFFEGIKIVDKVDYESIIREINLDNLEKITKIEPLYIKKPSIS